MSLTEEIVLMCDFCEGEKTLGGWRIPNDWYQVEAATELNPGTHLCPNCQERAKVIFGTKDVSKEEIWKLYKEVRK